MPGSTDLENFLREIDRTIFFDDAISTTLHAYDATDRFFYPIGVVRPRTVEELGHVVAAADRARLPITARGAGTGFSGGSLPVEGGIVLDLLGLNRIVEIDEIDMTAWVEPGVITRHFQDAVEAHGLYYPPDPASLKICTLGGNVAENAGGPHCLKYGVTRDYVMAIDGFTGDGRRFMAGKQVYKNRAGYDLRQLLIGSEGTLGVFAGFRLKLTAKPEARVLFSAYFDKMDDATEMVGTILRKGVTPSSLEFMDKSALEAVERYTQRGLPLQYEAFLLIEIDGRIDEIPELRKRVESALHGVAGEVRVATDATEQEKLWETRRKASPAMRLYGPTKMNEDIVVPRKCVPEAIRAIREIAERRQLKIISFGHIGDGNIHVNIMHDAADPEEKRRVDLGANDLFAMVNRLGGAISGEHGIGWSKKPYLQANIDSTSFALMREIKRTFDPHGILNPGKIFDC